MVGEIQVNKNIKPKTYLIIGVITCISTLITLVYLINQFIKTQNYVKVDAAIVEVGYDEVKTEGENHYYNYIILRYTYDNNSYTYKQGVIFRFNKREEDKIKIYINPEQPDEVRDSYSIRLAIIVCLFLGVFDYFCIKAYIVRKNG